MKDENKERISAESISRLGVFEWKPFANLEFTKKTTGHYHYKEVHIGLVVV